MLPALGGRLPNGVSSSAHILFTRYGGRGLPFVVITTPDSVGAATARPAPIPDVLRE